jgi:hypothetical protein
MFNNNWYIILVALVLVLIFAYFCNNYEGFATNNDEAIATIASVYNKNDMTLTNLTATNNITVNNRNIIGEIDRLNGLINASNAKIAALEGRAGALEGRAGGLEGRENNYIKVNDPIAINSMMDGGDGGIWVTKKAGGYFMTDITGVDKPNKGGSDSAHGKKFKLIRYPY